MDPTKRPSIGALASISIKSKLYGFYGFYVYFMDFMDKIS
jgi:hypothetical protein